MTRQTFIATDASKFAVIEVEPILRPDRLGNRAGGFTVYDPSPRVTLTFEQAEGRRFVEALAEKFGGRAEWGLAETNASSQRHAIE